MEWDKLLDWQSNCDESLIKLFDAALENLNNPVHSKNVQSVLWQLQKDNNSWKLVQPFFQYSQHEPTRLLGLSLLRYKIKTGWDTFLETDKCAVIQYVLLLICAAVESQNASFTLLTKLDEIVVEVIKQVWPHQWPDFLDNLLQPSDDMNRSLLTNNLTILKLLCEDIIEFGDRDLTSDKRNVLLTALKESYVSIFSKLVAYLRLHVNDQQIATLCIEIISIILPQCKIDLLYEINIIEAVFEVCWNEPKLRPKCLDCLLQLFTYVSEFFSNHENKAIDSSTDVQMDKLVLGTHQYIMFFINKLNSLPKSIWNTRNLTASDQKRYWENFFLQAALVLTKICSSCLILFYLDTASTAYQILAEQDDYFVFNSSNIRRDAITLLIKLFMINNNEVFCIMTDFWSTILPDLLSFLRRSDDQSLHNPRVCSEFKSKYYDQIDELLNGLRDVAIFKMVRPPEIAVDLGNERGMSAKVSMASENLNTTLYNRMKTIIISLTKLNSLTMFSIYQSKLAEFLATLKTSRSNNNFNIAKLQSLVWSAGCATGIIDSSIEMKIFVCLTRHLLDFCQCKKGKDDKSIIASLLMYTIRQFSRYVKRNEKVLVVVLQKCFEFIHDPFQGIQEMSIDCIYKLATTAGKEIYMINNGAFIHQFIKNSADYAAVLHKIEYVHLLYQALSEILYKGYIASNQNLVTNCIHFANLFDGIYRNFNALIKTLVGSIQAQNYELPQRSFETVRDTVQLTQGICESARELFLLTLFLNLFPDFIETYKYCNLVIEQYSNLSVNSEHYTLRNGLIKLFIALTHASAYLPATEPKSQEINKILENEIVSVVFASYSNARNYKQRDSEIIKLAAAFAQIKYKDNYDALSEIVKLVFNPSVEMLNNKLDESLDIRRNLYMFVTTIIEHSFEFLIKRNELTSHIGVILYGINEIDPGLGLLALNGLTIFLSNLTKSPIYVADFINGMFKILFESLLVVIFDQQHVYGESEQVKLLYNMLQLFRNSSTDLPQEALIEFIYSKLYSMYPLIPKEKICVSISQLLNADNIKSFRTNINDLKLLAKEEINVN